MNLHLAARASAIAGLLRSFEAMLMHCSRTAGTNPKFSGGATIQGILYCRVASDAAVFNGKTVKFTSTGQYNLPTAGLKYSSYFKPKGMTYDEVKP